MLRMRCGSRHILFVIGRRHYYIIGVALLLTGITKLLSIFGNTVVLSLKDPLFGIRYDQLFVSLGTLEIICGAYLIAGGTRVVKGTIAQGLAVEFILYRTVASYYDVTALCPCMGHAASWLGLEPGVVDALLGGMAGYMLLATLVTETWLWRRRKRMLSSGLSY